MHFSSSSSSIDLLTTETLYNKSKVSLKLHELEYKLDVENKVLEGIKTMADVMDRDPSLSDRKRRLDLQGQMYESIEKFSLMTKALRKYKSLYIGEGDGDDDYGKSLNIKVEEVHTDHSN